MSFWKKLAKIALIAAPIAAAPFTGGASLALIGAAAGAARGAMGGGGLKGAIMGGAMGAIPGVGAAKGASSIAAEGLKAGIKQAAVTAVKSPSVWGQVAGAMKNPNTAGAAGEAIGAATTASGNNRLNQQTLSMQGNRDNVAGNAAAEDMLTKRSVMEGTERRSALQDIARMSDMKNQRLSEFNTRGPKVYSPEMMASMTALEQRGMSRLQADPTYSTDKMTPLRTYKPLDIQNLQKDTNTQAGTMEKIGQYAGPALSTYAAIMKQAQVPVMRNHAADDEDFTYGG